MKKGLVGGICRYCNGVWSWQALKATTKRICSYRCRITCSHNWISLFWYIHVAVPHIKYPSVSNPCMQSCLLLGILAIIVLWLSLIPQTLLAALIWQIVLQHILCLSPGHPEPPVNGQRFHRGGLGVCGPAACEGSPFFHGQQVETHLCQLLD